MEMVSSIYCEEYDMLSKRENVVKESNRLYKKHLLLEKMEYKKSLRKKRLKAELYIIIREHLEKLIGKHSVNINKRKEIRNNRRESNKGS